MPKQKTIIKFIFGGVHTEVIFETDPGNAKFQFDQLIREEHKDITNTCRVIAKNYHSPDLQKVTLLDTSGEKIVGISVSPSQMMKDYLE